MYAIIDFKNFKDTLFIPPEKTNGEIVEIIDGPMYVNQFKCEVYKCRYSNYQSFYIRPSDLIMLKEKNISEVMF